jgi:mRNA export factor
MWNLETIFNGQFNPINVIETPLRFTTSAIACFGDGKGYAVGSIEGRCGIVNVNFNNLNNVDTRDFCFKCHRQENSQTKEGDVWTVNSIAFNEKFNTFVTVGSDGQWYTWNKDTKSRYKQSNKSQMPVTNACFSEDAMVLVHAHGEDWSLGGNQAQKRPNNIKLFFRRCEKDDVFKPPKNK